MSRQTPPSRLGDGASVDERVTVEARDRGEWIVGAQRGCSLHVYRLAAADWLVSVVGRGSEGRGSSLRQALAMLSVDVPSAPWWDLVAEMLDGGQTP